MSSNPLHRLRRLCEALPKSKLDEQLASFSVLQRLLVFAVTVLVVLTAPPLLVNDAAAPTVGIALGFGTLSALSALVARYNQR